MSSQVLSLKGLSMSLTRVLCSLRKPLAIATVLATLSLSSEANAGWFTRLLGGGHSNSGGSSSGGGGSSGGSSGGGVPEIDAGAAAGAITLLAGSVLMLRDRFNLRPKRPE